MGNFQVVKDEPLIDNSLALSICLLLCYQFIKLTTDYSLYNAAVSTSHLVYLYNLACFKLKSFIDFEINIVTFLNFNDSMK